jgi:hypothetical protein
MKTTYKLLLVIGFTALLLVPQTAFGQVSLGTAQGFGVLAGTTVTNTGTTTVTGDVGTSPGSSITGFPPGIVVPPGVIRLADGVAGQAQIDLTTAYNAAAGTACTVNLTGQDLGGLTLTPGVYCFDVSAQLTGTLTLDFQGNPNALFIFKTGSTLTTAGGSSVVLTNNGGGTCPANLFWQIGSSATLGTSTSFAGNILALTSITLNAGAIVNGRTLARNGAVTLSSNTVTACGPLVACPIITLDDTLPDGSVTVAYVGAVIASPIGPTYAYTLTSGALPTGLLLDAAGNITGIPTAPGTFNFTITATDTDTNIGCFGSRSYEIIIAAVGCPAILVNPPTLPPATVTVPYSQTITASGGTGPYTFAITAGALPGGLVLNTATGAITGTPTVAGLFSFTIQATDSLGCLGSRAYSMSVREPSVAIPFLGPVGLMFLVAILAVAGVFALKGFSG